jgi:hypothetical protein
MLQKMGHTGAMLIDVVSGILCGFMRMLGAFILGVVTVLGAVGAVAQPATAVSLYADAKPYMDDPATLKLKIKELDGLKPDGSREELPKILSNAGAVIMAQMPRVPNLIALEEIAQEQPQPPPTLGTGGLRGAVNASIASINPNGPTALVPENWRRFEYLIMAEHQSDGSTVFDESRKDLDKSDRAAAPHGTGFGSLWLMLVPAKQGESSFRYLGTQKVDKHSTFVVGFAQNPKLVKVPGVIQTDKGEVPLLYQGIAWIDQDTYKIVRLRTDLLAPLPSIKLLQATSTVVFSEVEIPKFDTLLWLPKTVEITWDLDGNRLGELHRYSKYRLFAATSRIVPTSN